MRSHIISIWFFIGLLLSIYGVLIGGYGVLELITHHTAPVTLARLHAPVWWGGGMFALGMLYCLKFPPSKS